MGLFREVFSVKAVFVILCYSKIVLMNEYLGLQFVFTNYPVKTLVLNKSGEFKKRILPCLEP